MAAGLLSSGWSHSIGACGWTGLACNAMNMEASSKRRLDICNRSFQILVAPSGQPTHSLAQQPLDCDCPAKKQTALRQATQAQCGERSVGARGAAGDSGANQGTPVGGRAY